MIWPFKKKEPAIPFAEYAMTLPKPPCGDNVLHYEWEKAIGMICPKCHAERKRREKDAELDALADKVVARLRVHGVTGAQGFDLLGIAQALRAQRQVDEDGAEVGVSRQAADEAATIIEGLAASGVAIPHRTHTTDSGESLCGIAIRQLGNERRWTEIRDLNADRFPDMLGSDYYPVGTVIKLPPKEQQ